jgi:hypothetical protein
MPELINESYPTARKDYNCAACERLRDVLGDKEFTISEYREIVKAKRQNWKIKKGQKYFRQVLTDGEIYTWRAIPEIDQICRDHNLYKEY